MAGEAQQDARKNERGPVSVLIVEDHTIVREGLRALLETRREVCVVGEAVDGEQAVQRVRALRPDVVLMDLSLPGVDGIGATRAVREASPRSRVLVLSMHADEEHVRPALRAGASGYLVKGAGLSDLVRAIVAVASGDTFLSPQAATALTEDPSVEPLTRRERQVLALVVDGLTSGEIAARLGIGARTVEGHRATLMQKLGARNAAELVRLAVRRGLVP
ncbi:MAG: response regulator transcription factor [Myxococcota bacterium]|nr:response regulator transcription factor [Myxococcota bacterium]MDW8360926.1 response regulator transcription factor [Myxococcales bacterium]